MALSKSWKASIMRNIAESFFSIAMVWELLMATPARSTPLPAMPPRGLSPAVRGSARARGVQSRARYRLPR
eukprot:241422-Pyramimonas_sp.AAC.1